MSDYSDVKTQMQAGMPGELICATCPWSRPCVSPPSMSSTEVDRQIKEAEQEDLERDPTKKSFPVGMLLSTIVLAGKDTAGQLCPVFASRFTGPEGRRIADGLREQMKGWAES